MSFGFAEGFAAGSSIVDTYMKVKKTKEDNVAIEAAATKKAKGELDKGMMSFNNDLLKDLDAYATQQTKYKQGGDFDAYNKVNGQINARLTNAAEAMANVNASGAGNNYTMPEVSQQLDTTNISVIEKFGKKYMAPENFVEEVDSYDDDAWVDMGTGQLGLKSEDGKGGFTDQITTAFQPFGKNDSDGKYGKGIQYAKVDGVKGIYPNEELVVATKSGKSVEKIFKPDSKEESIKAYMNQSNGSRVDAEEWWSNKSIPATLKIENASADLFDNVATNLGVDIMSYDKSKHDNKTNNKIKATGLRVLRQRSGKNAPKIIGDARRVTNTIDKLSMSGDKIDKAIADGKNVNFTDKLYREYIGKWVGDIDEADYDTLKNDKRIAEVFNNIRHSLFGSVLTAGESAKFYEQAASLYETNKTMVIGIEAQVSSQIDELTALQDQMGEDVFRSQFGNRLDVLEERQTQINDITSNKKSETKKKKSWKQYQGK